MKMKKKKKSEVKNKIIGYNWLLRNLVYAAERLLLSSKNVYYVEATPKLHIK